MLINVRCCYIMISCPSDVTESEDALKIINEWNSKYTKDFNICFIPQFWQINTTSNINGERPQEILNRSLVYNSDCIVVIFWGKFGSDTGKEASGTLEELKTAYELKKKIGLFFCEKPISPSKLNPKDLMEIKTVKENFGKLGIYQTYSHEYDFRAKFNHFLHEFASETDQKSEEESSSHDVETMDFQASKESGPLLQEKNDKTNIPVVLTTPSTTKLKELLLNIKPKEPHNKLTEEISDFKTLQKIIEIFKDEELIKTLTTHQIPEQFSKKAFEQLQSLSDLRKEADFFFFDMKTENFRKSLLTFASRIHSFLKLYYREDGEILNPSPALQKQITNETITVIHDYERSAKYFLSVLQRLVTSVKEPSA